MREKQILERLERKAKNKHKHKHKVTTHTQETHKATANNIKDYTRYFEYQQMPNNSWYLGSA
jgi:hypothetical protein